MAAVVDPTSMSTTSPEETSPAAWRLMSAFSASCSPASCSSGRSTVMLPDGTAPPRTRRIRPRDSSAARSERTVTVETANRSARSVTREKPLPSTASRMRSCRTSTGKLPGNDTPSGTAVGVGSGVTG